MMLFAIVFGLSMDYEVFLLSRGQGTLRRNQDNHHAPCVDGLGLHGPRDHRRSCDHGVRVRQLRGRRPSRRSS